MLGKAFGNRALVLTHLVWEQHFTWRSEQVPNGILSSVDILSFYKPVSSCITVRSGLLLAVINAQVTAGFT